MSSQQVAERDRADQTAQRSAIVVFRDRLLDRRDELSAALEGSGISTDRFIRTALTAVQTNNDLLSDVSFQSMWLALQQSARDQIPPDGVRGVIYAFKREAKWVPMVRGMIERFQRSGEFKWIAADFHRDDDIAFDVWIDEHGQHFLHRPGPRQGKIIETFAAALTLSGGFFLTVISEPDMQRIRNVSSARSADAPWQKWPEQMMLKSSIKRLCKILPMPQQLEELIERDDDGVDTAAFAPTKPAPRLARPRSAAQALDQFATGGDAPPGEDDVVDKVTGEITTTGNVGSTSQPNAQPQPAGNEDGLDIPEGLRRERPSSPAGRLEIPQIRIDVAYERGRDDRTKGMKRTASPPEYREPGREPEMAAWRNGWDGVPLGDQ